ncbi:hypothetical protein ACFVXC_06850 [Streptomyces sp. NPDC058257]|uniref:hypothetical protein n=1 Tax=Streptomyces sp. NPDC058257 TaxID=3346409 RepID=UPI0036ECC85B
MNGTAVVIGGSVAGLLAACALHDQFERVVLIGRDRLPQEPEPRRDVPQGRQLHALLGRGLDAVEALLPGFRGGLRAAGAMPFDVVQDLCICMDGRLMANAPSG